MPPNFTKKLILFRGTIIFLLLSSFFGTILGGKDVVRCLGTNSAYSVSEDRMDHYLKMVKRFTNCTVVHGNLEIAGLEDPDIDTSFLKDIEVVTGYVLIAINYVPYLPLENLKIIRGQELYGEKKLALNVLVNYNRDDPSHGLKQLGFKSLTEIQRGNVSILQNNRMCFAEQINWDDIINRVEREKHGWRAVVNNTVDPRYTKCGGCDESCGDGGCWGEGADMCQVLTSTICHPKCGDSRCRGPSQDDCCDSECASGCTGPTDRDCITCLHVNNNGVCQQSCPPQFIYDPQTSRNVPNPYFKYHFNDLCVDKCPKNMLVEENGCVKHCRKGRHNNGSGVCVPCTGNECNKECFGVGDPDGPLKDDETVDSRNVKFFKGCNIVRGNVIFQAYAFTGDNHTNTPPMTAEQIKAFSGVKVINGFLKILSWPDELHDFSVFANLTTIMGVDLFRDTVALLIQDSITQKGPFHLSHVKQLGFHSLDLIKYGNVYIGYMKQLCYQNLVNWSEIIKSPVPHHSFENGLLLRANKADCRNRTCDPACSKDGCWGPGANECLSCLKITYEGVCRMECNKDIGIFRDGDRCKKCHGECNRTCSGAGPRMCTSCLNFKDGQKCVKNCPSDKYADHVTKECLACHENCFHQGLSMGNSLCSGPNSTLGFGGCEYCHTVVTNRDLRVRECLPRSQRTCPEAHFLSRGSGLVKAKRACVPCADGCRNCTGATDKDCAHALPVKSDKAVIIAVVITIVALGLIALSCFLVNQRREKSRKKRQCSMRALGLEGAPEPMTPSGVAPNQAQLRIVKETELKIMKILGSGAFGTVHKGYWIPDLAPREKVKVPVAIKVLRDESSQVASNEILDEAFVMASCEHPNLVRILGISLSQKIMLITQLMPLGNLLEYVRDNKDNIGSQSILNWCVQIAKGMCYLAEEKHLVHRDLAARNVLVKSPNQVRITDFGLAKLLDVNQDVYKAEGGKMPIKWLALESIQKRIFTQKSDVWSFGVTIWELMTFGKKPYENVPAREVHTLLERGERLLQPHTCSIDVYMLMIKCWTVDADSRPTFRELVEDFSKMARDPLRYLVIPNDGQLPDLPSPTTSEFFRTLKFEEGDDFPLQDAEEYFNPINEEFDPPIQNGGHFPLQPVPSKIPWRNAIDHRFAPTASSSTADSRLDSAVTVMTSLPSESGVYPNGCSTPFAFTPVGSITPGLSQETSFGAFVRSNSKASRENSAINGMQSSNIGPRTQSESSDVFLNTPSTQRKDSPWELSSDVNCVPEHPGVTRAREDSATMRYSAEPILTQRERISNAQDKHVMIRGFRHDEDGYLEPSDAAQRKPEYIDPMSFRACQQKDSQDSLLTASPIRGQAPLLPEAVSSVNNPEYEPTFTPEVRSRNFAPGMHNLMGGRASLPVASDDGYEVPMSYSPKSNRSEYENVCNVTLGDIKEDNDGYLTPNLRMLPQGGRGSQSGESTASEKRDSGLQSEGDEDAPLKAKNVKAAGGDVTNLTSGLGVRKRGINPTFDAQESPGGNIYLKLHKEKDEKNTSVDNPNYELLEDMTDGGFEPMSEFKPRNDLFSLNNGPVSNGPTSYPIANGKVVFQNGNASPVITSPRKNHLKLTINCDGSGTEDLDDNIFVTPESRRRNTPNGKLTPVFDELAGKQGSRTYSEPDSGVGIEMAVDNILYHRLGSSGWDGSD